MESLEDIQLKKTGFQIFCNEKITEYICNVGQDLIIIEHIIKDTCNGEINREYWTLFQGKNKIKTCESGQTMVKFIYDLYVNDKGGTCLM